MKVSTFLLVSGGAIIVGTAAYSICKYYQNKNDDVNTPLSISNINQFNTDAEQTVMSELKKTHHRTVDSIKARHDEAAQQIKDTLNEMVIDNLEFDKSINQINDDLDDLIK